MRLDRKTRVNADLQVVVVGCSDDLCSPTWAARQYLLSHGIVTEIPDSNIHPVRDPGGVFTGELIWGEGPECEIVREHTFKEIGFLIEKKGASWVFVTGHNPCAGCNTINVDVARQQERVISDAEETARRYDVKVVAMLEEHVHGNCEDHYAVLKEFNCDDKAIPIADAA
jgi:hypothetical protein